MARRMTGFWCAQPTTRYAIVCGDPARFLVGIPGKPGSPSCAQHLAKAVDATIAQHQANGAVVNSVPYKEDTEAA